MIATYHNHTTYSDGKNTPTELARAAAVQGVQELGISDHFLLHKDGRSIEWAMPVEAVHTYIKELSQIRAKHESTSGMFMRLGLEVDWFPDHEQLLHDALDPLPLDYVIGSVHFVGDMTIDCSPHAWRKRTEHQRNDIHRAYWQHMISLAESGVFNIVAHIDLPKKFGFHATVDMSNEINAALDAIAKQPNLVVELNTAGWHKPCADAYPTADIVAGCFVRNIPMTISADAHKGEHLTRDFDRAASRLRAAGYTEIARFAERKIWMEPIDQCVSTTL